MSGLTEMLGRAGWSVADGWEPKNAAVCGKCHREVLWCTRPGRVAPFNRDGTRHPIQCSVSINQVRRGERGRPKLMICPYCEHGEVHYPAPDFRRHLATAHNARA